MRINPLSTVLSLALLLAAPGSHALANPLDSDGDGITDWIEIHLTGTDPDDWDTDDDGLGDLELPEVIVWGENNYGQTNVPSDLAHVVGVDAGGAHSVVLLPDGTAAAWGRNNSGQTNVPPALTNATMVSAGGDFNLALLQSGAAEAWGGGGWGQTAVPADVTNAVAVGTGTYHAQALRQDGSIEAWGRNDYGQCDVPTDVTNAIAVAGGTVHSAALLDDGIVVAWGRNNNGQTNVPGQVTNAVALAANGGFSLALLADGNVVAWGANNWGQANVPADVTNAVAVAAGNWHGLAVLEDGTVTGWGNSDYGQTTPPAEATNVVAIDGGGTFSIALCLRGDPMDPDKDDDGMLDGDEVLNGLDPLTSNIGMDSDGDGLPDRVEVNGYGTNPNQPSDDDDGDGLADDWEVARGMDPMIGDTNFHFVDVLNPTPSAPHTDWATAANTIQAAVDVAVADDVVLVADGIYDSGATATPGFPSLNRLVVAADITVLSLSGPEQTLIMGEPDPVTGGNGSNAVRGVYMSAGTLSGFTITNGYTMDTGSSQYDQSGGGINLMGGSGVVTHCTLSGNEAHFGGGSYGGTLTACTLSGNEARIGGGSYQGTLTNCSLSGNSASVNGGGSCQGTLHGCTLSDNSADERGGGSSSDTLYDCTLSGNSSGLVGGGSYYSTLYNCTLSGNEALGDDDGGGGSSYSTLYNCILFGNSAITFGGGSSYSTLTNCTVVGNSAGIAGGGSYGGILYSCIVWHNYDYDWAASTCHYCCTIPENGIGCITQDPLFVDASARDYRLQLLSPCIDAGTNMPWMAGGTDLDGNERLLGPAVDMGAYEYTRADYFDDGDSDGLTDREEHHLGTNPLNRDTDDDGFDDLFEANDPELSPTNSSHSITSYIQSNVDAFGLYTSNSIMDLSMGYMMLQTSNGWLCLSLQLEQTTNLDEGVWTNAGDAVEWIEPGEEGKEFFRVRGSP